MSSRALIVTYYWPPSGGAGVQRPLKFAKYLPQFGIEPFILTVENPTYPILDESLADDVPDEATVYTSKTLEPFSLYAKLTGKSVEDSTKPTIDLQDSANWKTRLSGWIRANLFIPDARAGWLITARSKAQSIVDQHDIDAIITTGPPHSVHFVGKHVKENSNINWIADLRDPWTGVYYNKLMPRSRVASDIDQRLEQSVLKTADDVVVISKTMAEIQKKITDRKYHVIPNGFDPEDFEISGVTRKNKPLEERPMTIRFVGSVRDGAIPEGFLKALANLDNPKKFEMEFIGNAHPALQQWVDDLGLNDQVQIKDYVPHEEAIRAMCTADLLLLSISKTPGSELILTGKLFEYLGSGTPILFMGATHGDAADVIRKAGQGACFEHDQVEQITTFLNDFNEAKARELQKPRGDRQHPYSRIPLTKQLAELISKP